MAKTVLADEINMFPAQRCNMWKIFFRNRFTPLFQLLNSLGNFIIVNQQTADSENRQPSQAQLWQIVDVGNELDTPIGRDLCAGTYQDQISFLQLAHQHPACRPVRSKAFGQSS